jgi:uncharacterized protein YdaL
MRLFRRVYAIALFFLILGLIGAGNYSNAQESSRKHALILFEGSDTPANLGRGDARQLAMLMGHFTTDFKLQGLDTYHTGDVEKYDITFFIGFSTTYAVPSRFMKDVFSTKKEVVWMNTGIEQFSHSFNLKAKYGMAFVRFDSLSIFDEVRARGRTFTKGEENLNVMLAVKDSPAEVVATAYSSKTRKEAPYIIRSKNFLYIADSPFASATETDRYILFADMLHELLGEQHEEIHRALLRIEDVDVFENPDHLRSIADMLYAKHVPFLVGIIPFFVDPGAGMRLSLSDKPEFVDAIHYMVEHGATIIMHGVTHQYQGVTAVDYEFWDGSMGKPIKGDTREYVRKKIKMGLEECWKNNIYPLVWETPHYAASQIDYPVFGTFFSTAMEQRQVIDNLDYGQYFPYIIEHDLYGQRILPENLGYIPQDEDTQVEEHAVQQLLRGAEAQLAVRDGFASAFIHPFVGLEYMEQFVDGVLALGYTYMDVKREQHVVQLPDHIVLTGDTSYAITLEDQYLRETWLNAKGQVDRWEIARERTRGTLNRTVSVPPGEIYVAEPSEYRETKLTLLEKIQTQAKSVIEAMFPRDESFDEARVAILWDTKAAGGALNDQLSFVSAFHSLNIPVDTLWEDSISALDAYNLLIIPYHTVERLSNHDYDKIVEFVEEGGHVITDGKNGVAEEFGVKFAASSIKIERMRDRLYPEDALVLPAPEIMTRFEVEAQDEVFCVDERTEAAVVISRNYGNGGFLFLGIRFDPSTNGGYSRFPYLIEYVGRFARLRRAPPRESEVYFDPGYRRNVSEEDLVKRWVADGIRTIHVAGWHQYPTWTYAYEHLIDLCHANGISVYAWLEPPHVSQKFWKDHPEWRELNYKGEQVPPQWRYVMALTSPECLRTVKATYKEFLRGYDWDGVNLAELYFESGNGPRTPNLLTPMHPSSRDEFSRKSGFDQVFLLDSLSEFYWKSNHLAWKKFEDYRVETLVRLHEEFLKMIDEVRAEQPHLRVIVTAMDNLGSPELRQNFGVDIQRIIELQKKYSFALQIEDPQSQWSKDPRRYSAMGKRYASLVRPGQEVMVDLNILQFRSEHTPTIFPTLVQTGIEAYHLVHSAALGAERYTIYSESSVRPQDLRLMSYAASAQAFIGHIPGGWHIVAPTAVVLDLPKEYASLQFEGGDQITSDRGLFYIPPGDHRVIAQRQSAGPFLSAPRTGALLSVTGELLSMENQGRTVTFSYRARGCCLVHPRACEHARGQAIIRFRL